MSSGSAGRDRDKAEAAAAAAVPSSSRIASRVRDLLRKQRAGTLTAEELGILEREVTAYQERVSRELAALIMLGYVRGASLGSKLAGPPPVAPDLLTPLPDDLFAEFPALESAITRLWRRQIMFPEQYYALESAAKQNAFSITADLSRETISRVHQLLAEQFEGPTDRGLFTRKVQESIAALPMSDAHIEQVYRNAVNSSYSDGLDDALQSPIVEEGFPYRAVHAIHDDRVRETHLAIETAGLNGTNVFHYRDPVFLMFRGPWEWNCRCGWNPLSVRQAAAAGVEEAREWLRTDEEPEHPAVPWPMLNGQQILPDPRWQRLQVA